MTEPKRLPSSGRAGAVRRRLTTPLALAVLSAGVFASSAGACGGSSDDSGAGSPTGGGDTGGNSLGGNTTGGSNGLGGSDNGGSAGTGDGGPRTDFPSSPVIDTSGGGVPSNIAMLFGGGGAGSGGAGGGASGGPCLVDPQIGSLFPNNWVRPRFTLAPVGDQNVFEIRIHAPNQTNDLVVYTAAKQWTMAKDQWAALVTHSVDLPLTVSVRGATLSGQTLSSPPALGSSGEMRVAPVPAAGSVVYWHTLPTANSGELKGFTIGDETVEGVLTTDQTAQRENGNPVTCLGCHTSTPDGAYAAFKTLDQKKGTTGTVGDVLASVEKATIGAAPPFLAQGAVTAISPADLGVPSFSKGHWAEKDYVMLSSTGNDLGSQLAWFDLEATSSTMGTAFGTIARNGDTQGACMPSWSHDGKFIVYDSGTNIGDGRPYQGHHDLYKVPYNDRAGGDAKPIAGASDPKYNEYYPALSPDDLFVAFNRVADGAEVYNIGPSEVWVVPTAGGDAQRLMANDAAHDVAACPQQASPGLTNSWPKWAPEATSANGKTYYWLTFSSHRNGSAVPQLYATAVVVDGTTVLRYPALYFWNQPADEANHTPAWDVFKIPSQGPHLAPGRRRRGPTCLVLTHARPHQRRELSARDAEPRRRLVRQ